MGLNNEDGAAEEAAKTSKGLNEERRAALRRIGKLGAYTAPALLAMLTSAKAAPVTDAF
jgi:hypothetical protein